MKKAAFVAAVAVSSFAFMATSFASTHVKNTASSVPIYFSSLGITHGHSNALDLLANTDHIDSVAYGTLLLKPAPTTCTLANLYDNVSPNPITDGGAAALNKYHSENGAVTLTFGGAVSYPGSTAPSLTDPTVACNDGTNSGSQLATLVNDTIAKVGSSVVAGVDFDIENNIHENTDDQAYWTNLGEALKQIKAANPNIKITITLPQYSSYWSPGYNAAMRSFFATYKADIDTYNVLINNMVPLSSGTTQQQIQSVYQSVVDESLDLNNGSGYQGVNFMVTDASSPLFTNYNEKWSFTAANHTYIGTSIYSAVTASDDSRNCTAINAYEVLNGASSQNTCTGSGPTPPGPTPTKNQLVLNYAKAGSSDYGTLSCWNNTAHAVTLGTVNLNATTAIGQTGSGAYTTAVCAINGADDGATFTLNGNAWTATPTGGVEASCNGDNCTIGRSE